MSLDHQHLVHLPYQVPQNYLDAMSAAGGGPFHNDTAQDTMRMTYHAMVKCLDDHVGMLVRQFQDKKMWDNTLLCKAPELFCAPSAGRKPAATGGLSAMGAGRV